MTGRSALGPLLMDGMNRIRIALAKGKSVQLRFVDLAVR